MANQQRNQTRGILGSLAQDLGAGRSPNRDTAPLGALENVTFVSGSVFLKELGTLERLLREAPIELKRGERYFLAVREGALHVYGAKEGITAYELAQGAAGIKRILHSGGSTTIQIEGENGPLTVVLHGEPFAASSDPQGRRIRSLKSAPRTSNPWRASQLAHGSCASSESRSGSRCGES